MKKTTVSKTTTGAINKTRFSKPPLKKKTSKKIFRGIPPLIPSNPEVKAVDTDLLTVFPLGMPFHNDDSTAGKIILVNGMNVGADRFNRIGRKVRITGIHMRFVISQPTTAQPPSGDWLHAYLVYADDAIAPTNYSNLFNNTDAAGAQVSNDFSFPNLDNSHRYRVVRSHHTRCGPFSIATTGAQTSPPMGTQNESYSWEWHIPCDVITQWNSAGTVTNGAFYLGVQALRALSTVGADYTLIGGYRVRYIDD